MTEQVCMAENKKNHLSDGNDHSSWKSNKWKKEAFCSVIKKKTFLKLFFWLTFIAEKKGPFSYCTT